MAAARQRKRPGALTVPNFLADTKQSEISNIRKEYELLKTQIAIFPSEKQKYEEIEKFISTIRCDEQPKHGAHKTVKKCPPYKENHYIVKISNASNDEILRHIKLLQIYYNNGGMTLNFKIPNIYLKITDIDVDYFMDYINIATGQEFTEIAKNHNIDDKNILINIGKILGTYANISREMIYDFELYLDLNDNIFTILDFGEVLYLKEEKEVNAGIKPTYNEHIYEGIKSIFNIPSINLDNYIMKQDIKKYEEFKEALYKRKYMKYKMKYLRLKQQFNKK